MRFLRLRRGLALLALAAFLAPAASSWLAVCASERIAACACGSSCCAKPHHAARAAGCHDAVDSCPTSLQCRHDAAAADVPSALLAILRPSAGLAAPPPLSADLDAPGRSGQPGFHRIDPLPTRSLASAG